MIKIVRNKFGMYSAFSINKYYSEEPDYTTTVSSSGKCDICNNLLENWYLIIIDKLKDGGFLTEDFKKICCLCNLIKEFIPNYFEILKSLAENNAKIVTSCYYYYKHGNIIQVSIDGFHTCEVLIGDI